MSVLIVPFISELRRKKTLCAECGATGRTNKGRICPYCHGERER